MSEFRGKRVSIIFQDPMTSLNPTYTIGNQLREAILLHTNRNHEQANARALAVNPRFIICDEPVSALDVSIQAQIINTFEDLQKKLGIAYLFIAHDLLVVQHISHRIAVMYLGRIVEVGTSDDVIDRPQHPYTQSLISAIPIPDPDTARTRHRIPLEGDVPSPLHMPTGCPFRTRCRYATDKCARECPPLAETAPGHSIACWNPHY